jgi:hypothetical protein
MKHLTEEKYGDLVAGKKVDVKATIAARRSTHSPEEETDHPLVEQSKAMMKMADQLAISLKGSNGEVAKAVARLAASMSEHNEMLIKLLDRHSETVNKMMSQMGSMHRDHQNDMSRGKERKPWKLKVNRNDSGFMETIDIVPVEGIDGN